MLLKELEFGPDLIGVKIRSLNDLDRIGTITKIRYVPDDSEDSFDIRWSDGHMTWGIFWMWDIKNEIVEE